MRLLILLFALFAIGWAAPATARDVCPLLRVQVNAPVVANRIAAAACEEHLLWHRPFIDAQGRLASQRVTEAETAQLGNGELAWRRVAAYWRESGLLGSVSARAGASDCAYAYASQSSPACRAFVVDVPWSAAFISWLMRRAAVPGFGVSSSHMDYVRSAFRSPQSGPYRAMHPQSTRPRVGDLLCYVRSPSRIFGWDGLQAEALGNASGLPMHCDAVVAVNPDGDGMAYLVGGNVIDGVTMRLLPMAGNGLFQDLPLRSDADLPCAPDAQAACGFNRQDWAVLLQLRTPEELQQLPPSPPLLSSPAPLQPRQPQAQECCVYCVAGGSVPRCPDAGAVRPPNP